MGIHPDVAEAVTNEKIAKQLATAKPSFFNAVGLQYRQKKLAEAKKDTFEVIDGGKD